MRLVGLLMLLWCGGCGDDSCADVDCFLSHLQLQVNGATIPTVRLELGAIEASLQPGGTAPLDLATSGSISALGCFADDATDRDLDGASSWSSSLTIESCAQSCAGWGYFGVQDQSWCYCGNQAGRYGATSASECNLPCSGATGESCGGYLRNQIYAFPGATVPRDAGPPIDAGGAPTPVFAPSITVAVGNLTLPVEIATPLAVSFDDPNGCTPSLCFSFCDQSSSCTGSRVCTHTLRDGLMGGMWRGALKPLVAPAGGIPVTLALHIDSFGTPDCADFPSLVEELARSVATTERPAAGNSVVVLTTIERSSSPSGGTSSLGGNATCGSSTDPCPGSSSCTYQACVAVDALGACKDGYRTSDGQEFDCASCGDCTAAASAINQHCCPE